MSAKYSAISFLKGISKWHGQVNGLKPAERSGLPDDLRDRTALLTDNHEEEEDAARAVDK